MSEATMTSEELSGAIDRACELMDRESSLTAEEMAELDYLEEIIGDQLRRAMSVPLNGGGQ